ncbi:MAG: hypothetical protein JXR23_08495 [Pontiellaceae bacterium]|nr:hypothetical protein [Pontiellaceae bacterium]
MKNRKLSKIAFVAGAVVFSALVGAQAVDLDDALDIKQDLNATASSAAKQLTSAASAADAKAIEVAKLVQAVVKYEVQQGDAAVERLKAAIAAGDDAAAKAAMKDLKDALSAAKNALKKKFPSNMKELVDGAKIVIPDGVSQQTVSEVIDTVDVPAAVGVVNPNASLTESKGVQGAQAQEAGLVAGATGLVTPTVDAGNDSATGV